jgi:hypothetical protein
MRASAQRRDIRGTSHSASACCQCRPAWLAAVSLLYPGDDDPPRGVDGKQDLDTSGDIELPSPAYTVRVLHFADVLISCHCNITTRRQQSIFACYCASSFARFQDNTCNLLCRMWRADVRHLPWPHTLFRFYYTNGRLAWLVNVSHTRFSPSLLSMQRSRCRHQVFTHEQEVRDPTSMFRAHVLDETSSGLSTSTRDIPPR